MASLRQLFSVCLPFLGDGGEEKRQWLASSRPWKGETMARGNTSAANLYLHKKKYFFVPGKNHVGKNVFARNSRAGFTGVWSCTSPSLLSSDSFASLLLHFLTAIPHSFPVCLLFLLQDILTVTAKHLCCTSSHWISQGFPVCLCCAYFAYFFSSLGYQMSSSTSLSQVTGHRNLHGFSTQFC